jgi:acetyltransferase-like isoleucine patch superfamily enzyme
MIKEIKMKILNYFFLQIQKLQKNKELQELENLKQKFKKIGKGFNLGKDYSVLNPHFMEFGDAFWASHRFRIEAISEYEGENFEPKITIGNNVVFNTDIHIGCVNKIEIGNNCLFASRIYITDHDHGDTTLNSLILPPAKRKLISKGAVIIKDNVWVGEGVAILSGVTISENVIIATNSVVTKDIPANSVVGGVPARILKRI